jgi:hypothetical protein
MKPMETLHSLPKIPDYVLGLLPVEERLQVELHTLNCVECRQALARERKIAALIRRTVHDTTQPAPARLAALKPDFPVKRTAPTMRVLTQLAPVTLITFIFAIGLLLQLTGFSPFQGPYTPAFIATISSPTLTPTTTRMPTATITALNKPDSLGKEINPPFHETNPVRTIDPNSSRETLPLDSSTSTNTKSYQTVSPDTLSPPPGSTPVANAIP